MTAIILLSAGIHPRSGRPAPVPAEVAATALAAAAGEEPVGLHAGPDAATVADHLGLGLSRIVHVAVPEGCDPLPALAGWLTAAAPGMILAGAQGVGGEDSGMLPYRLARWLGLPIVAGLAAMERRDGDVRLDQALPRGRRRRAEMDGPFVATVAACAMPRVFAPGAARRGRIETVATNAPAPAFDGIGERPHRVRPKLITGGVDAAGGKGRLLIDPSPEEAAAAIVAHLDRLGLLAGNGPA